MKNKRPSAWDALIRYAEMSPAELQGETARKAAAISAARKTLRENGRLVEVQPDQEDEEDELDEFEHELDHKLDETKRRLRLGLPVDF